MKFNTPLAVSLLFSAALVAGSLTTEAQARDPFGYAANYAAMQMYMQQQNQAQYGYGNGYVNYDQYPQTVYPNVPAYGGGGYSSHHHHHR